jgi:coproporphyrinogen III oxidase
VTSVHRVPAAGAEAARALRLVEALQRRFVERLESVARAVGDHTPFEPIAWGRDGGRHGGGERWGVGTTQVFDRASSNVSQVHYDDEPARPLASATALSTIVHPRNPRAPSIHVHISYTDTRANGGSWRIMADLNPSIPNPADTAAFTGTVRAAAGRWADDGITQGDRYFQIPALGRTRGVSHFYLEQHRTEHPDADLAFAERFGEAVIDRYAAILHDAVVRTVEPGDERRQLEYHTLYLFQVLTLDRGTTSGLLVHDQNDVGVLGSLPSHVDRDLLASWRPLVPPPQELLVDALVSALPHESPSPVTDRTKLALAAAVRHHFRAHPHALDLQARGDVIPPTVANHR